MNKILFCLFVLILPSRLAGQDTGSGLDFLNIGPTARVLALSEAGSASLIGPAAIYTNPSLLIFEPNSGLDVNYTLWISGVENQFAGVNLLRDSHALAFGVYNSRASEFDRTGITQTQYSISYLSLSAAGAYRLGPVSLGITAQYLREEIFELRANGYAITTGASAELADGRFRAGIVLKNLGKMEELDFQATRLPSVFSIGLASDIIGFTTPGENDLPVLVSLHANWQTPLNDYSSNDYLQNDDRENFLSLAVNVNTADLLYLQAGYVFGPTERPFSAGLGLNIEPVRINYALVPFTTGYGTVHSIGVQYYF